MQQSYLEFSDCCLSCARIFLRKLGTKRECLWLTDARNASAGMASVPTDSIGWELSEGSGCLEALYWFPVQRSVRTSGLLPKLWDISLMKMHLSRVSSALSSRAAAVNSREPLRQPLGRIAPFIGLLCIRSRIIAGDRGRGLTCDYPAESACCFVFGWNLTLIIGFL